MVTVFLIGAIIFGIAVLVVVTKLARRSGGRLNQQYYQERWLELLARVKTPEGMMLAIIDADKLLDQALTKSGYRGKTMGERLVAAQRTMSDNDAVWYAHKLRNRLVHEPQVRIKKREAQKALAGFKKALSDLGALSL
jgi:hypothetical protein